jgi:UDP-glucose 4-epimerase
MPMTLSLYLKEIIYKCRGLGFASDWAGSMEATWRHYVRVVVTGSSGQVGSYLVEDLKAKGHDVMGIDRRPSAWTDINQDVRHDLRVECDVIVHCAAQVSVSSSVENPVSDAKTNIEGSIHVLECARQNDARTIHFSSAAAYGDPIELPINEDHPTNPTSPYGLSKLTSERYAMMYWSLHGLPVTVFRPFNIFSARSDADNPYSGVIAHFIDRVAKGLPPIVHGDGSQTRDFVHVRDIQQSVSIALEDPSTAGKVFNIGTGRSTSVAELAEICCGLAGLDAPSKKGPKRKGDIEHSVADTHALSQHGYEPTTDLKHDLDALFDQKRKP